MRLLHLADLHIGKRVYEYSMLKEQEEAFRQVIEMIQTYQVDVVLIAGDIYDKAVPTMEGMKLLDMFLTTVKKMQVPVCIISGNHDSAERLSFGRYLFEEAGIYFSGTCEEELQQVTLSDEYGEVCITLLPFLRPKQIDTTLSQMQENKKGENTENSKENRMSMDTTQRIRQVLNRVTIDTSKRNVLVAHQFVGKDGKEPFRMDSETKSVGDIDFVDYRVFDAFDYVALGHLHGAQYVGRETVRYAGSFVKYSFSEARQKKSATLVTLGEKKPGDAYGGAELTIQIEQLPFTPLHDMRELRGTLAQLTGEDVLKEVDKEDYLHITLTEEEEIYDVFGKLRAVYPNLMVLDFENARTRAKGADNLTKKEILEKGILELFREFFEKQTGSVLEPVQEQILREIIEGSGGK